MRPIRNIKMVVKGKHQSLMLLKNKRCSQFDISFQRTNVLTVHFTSPSGQCVAPFVHEKLQKTPWPDESNGGVSPLMSPWCIFNVLPPQFTKHVFIFRKSDGEARLKHQLCLCTVQIDFLMWQLKAPRTRRTMSFFAAFICCKMKKKIILKIHKQSDFKQRELGGILSVSAVLLYNCDELRRLFFFLRHLHLRRHMQMLRGNWLRVKIRNRNLKVRDERRQWRSFINPLLQLALSSYTRVLVWFIKHLYLASFSVRMTERCWMWLLKTSSFNDVSNFLWWCSKVPPLIQVLAFCP